jgi:hypothetical protein
MANKDHEEFKDLLQNWLDAKATANLSDDEIINDIMLVFVRIKVVSFF